MEYYVFIHDGASGNIAAARRLFASAEAASHVAQRFNRLSAGAKITSIHDALTERCVWRYLSDDSALVAGH